MGTLGIDRSGCGFDICPMPRHCRSRRKCGYGRIVRRSDESPAERQAQAIIDLLAIDPALGRAALVRFFEEAGVSDGRAAVIPVAAAPSDPPPPKPRR